MSITGIVMIAFAVLFVAFFISVKITSIKNKENAKLKEELAKEEKKTEAFNEYIERMETIKNEEIKTNEKIKESTDEEAMAIAADIINRNNNRVRKQTKTKDKSNAKTSV